MVERLELYKNLKTGAVYQVQAVGIETLTYAAVPLSPVNPSLEMAIAQFIEEFELVEGVPF